MENATAVFTDYLFQVPNLLIVGATYVLIGIKQRIFPNLQRHHVWARIAPLAPIILCSGFVWIPGAGPEGVSVGSRIMLGIVLGAMAAHGHKIFRQSALGQDDRIKNRRLR